MHLLNVIGKDAQDLYETIFMFSGDDKKDITKFLAAFWGMLCSRDERYLQLAAVYKTSLMWLSYLRIASVVDYVKTYRGQID